MNMTIVLLIAGLVILTGVFVLAFLYRKEKRGHRDRDIRPYDFAGNSSDGGHILQDASAPSDEYDAVMERLVNLFETDKLCLKTDIRITDVASELAVGKGTLSRAIKVKTGKNFCQLVHYYRVREAMRIYANHPKMSVKEISKMVGFNSQTTFITAFGRHTGCTPAEWCRKFRQRSKTGSYGTANTRRKQG